MEVNFKKDSWHAKLYSVGYGPWTKLPANLCPYFWKVVLLVALMPISWLGYAVKSIRHDEIQWKVMFTLLFKISFLIAGMPALTILKVNGITGLGAVVFSYTIGAALFVAFLAGVGFLINKGIDKLVAWNYRERPSKPQKPKEDNIVLAFVKAKKQKYCPVINWHDETKEEKKKEPLSEAA